jgi:hypothetical protein
MGRGRGENGTGAPRPTVLIITPTQPCTRSYIVLWFPPPAVFTFSHGPSRVSLSTPHAEKTRREHSSWCPSLWLPLIPIIRRSGRTLPVVKRLGCSGELPRIAPSSPKKLAEQKVGRCVPCLRGRNVVCCAARAQGVRHSRRGKCSRAGCGAWGGGR